MPFWTTLYTADESHFIAEQYGYGSSYLTSQVRDFKKDSDS